MAYTTQTLITRSWNLSGVVSRDFQTVDGDKLNEGLSLLNEVISEKSANTQLIPYYRLHDFTLEAGKEDYFITNLVKAETFTFFKDQVRFSSYQVGMDAYFGSARPLNIDSLPVRWNTMRIKGGTTLRLYFSPDQDYPAQILGKFSLLSATLNEDLEETFDLWYISYLRYALAKYMCGEYGLTFAPQNEQQLNEYQSILKNVTPPDMRIKKRSTLHGNLGFDYPQYVLGRGFIAP